MTDFLVMHRSSDDDLDWRPVGTFYDRKSAEVEEVITEAATAGEGEYMAVPLGSCTNKVASSQTVLADPGEAEGE